MRDYLNKYIVNGDWSVEMKNTRLYKHFLEMRDEILKHKWFESERANKDVGFEYALINWIVKHKPRWDSDHKINNS
jgi:glutaredoxin-related protein